MAIATLEVSRYGEKVSQRDRVLADLRRAGLAGVCSSHWYREAAIPNARNRISELLDARFHIESFPCPDEHGPGYFKYVLLHDARRVCNSCRWRAQQLELIEAAG